MASSQEFIIIVGRFCTVSWNVRANRRGMNVDGEIGIGKRQFSTDMIIRIDFEGFGKWFYKTSEQFSEV